MAAAPEAPRRAALAVARRAADFKTCPLLYRFRTIDRLPERRSLAAARGTLVHAVLERLFDLPAAERTVAAAQDLVGRPGPAARGARASPSCSPQDDARSRRTAGVGRGVALLGRPLVETYFALEDPTRIEPAGREELVEVTLPDGLLLRGYVDRLDVAPHGELRVVDYKTGASHARRSRARRCSR